MWRSRGCLAQVRKSMLGVAVGCRRLICSDTPQRYAAVWGNGDYGRLGLGNLDSQWRPMPLLSFAFQNQNLKSIACGGAHTLFLTETGRVYATGLNDFGQLGVPGVSTYSMVPLEVLGLQKEVLHISAGYHHSCAITVDGEVYMWGRNSSGQLGLGKKAEKVVPVPTKVECLNGVSIKTVALASEHSVAVTDEGQALSWGGGGFGRLGHAYQSSFLGIRRNTSEYTPRHIKKLEGVKVKTIAAGLLHSACIDEHGSVYVFGERAFDKSGAVVDDNAMTSSMIGKVLCSQEVACGGYHTCVVTIPQMSSIYQKELKALFWNLLLTRCLVVGSIQQRFLEATSLLGVGEVLMELFLKMGNPLVDNWAMEPMWTTLTQH